MLLNKLEAIHHKFLETQEKLSDPEVVSDVKRFAKLNKEYKKLDEVNTIYQEYKTLLSNKEEAQEMLKDDDPEMKEMAKMELEAVNTGCTTSTSNQRNSRQRYSTSMKEVQVATTK